MKFYTSKIAVERQKMEDKSSFYVSSISIKYVALSIPPKKEKDWIVDEKSEKGFLKRDSWNHF